MSSSNVAKLERSKAEMEEHAPVFWARSAPGLMEKPFQYDLDA